MLLHQLLNNYTHYSNLFVWQELLAMMIKEEETLKKKVMTSIQTCKTELEKLYMELQMAVFEVTSFSLHNNFIVKKFFRLLDNQDTSHNPLFIFYFTRSVICFIFLTHF